MKRGLLIFVTLTLALLGVWGAASVDRCGPWPPHAPALTHLARGRGALKVGAGRMELKPHYPTGVGGYGPLLKKVNHALFPFYARALVMDIGGQQLGLVVLDALFIPPQLRDAIAQKQAFPTWVVATHTHTGPSGYDPRLASKLGALGPFSPEDMQVLVRASQEALLQAAASLKPARLELGQMLSEGVTAARSGSEADRRLTLVRFQGADAPLAQVLIVSAHPTLVRRGPPGLHPDWPGLLAKKLEEEVGGIALVLQGAAGNASIERDACPTPEAAADRLAELTRAIPTTQEPEELEGAWTEVHVSLPRPDARHMVPSFLKAAAENALCDGAEDFAVLHGLRLGSARLLWVPFEPSFSAGAVLEEQAGAARLISLADGYGGYVETQETAAAGQGESRGQYFGPGLLKELAAGAKMAGRALGEGPNFE